jgi:nuclear GTP-binding protein
LLLTLINTNHLKKASWVRILSKEYPTLAFHSSITNSFGRGSLILLLRQFATLHADRKQISVGLIGHPNSGKSSVINTLRKKKVCNTAPIAGETKYWQFITLTRRIYCIDCPGIVPPSSTDSDQDILLRGAVRVENVENPEQYIQAILNKVKTHHLERTYDVRGFKNSTEFLEQLARKGGRLLKGGEADLNGVAKMVINDFIRGKIPWFTPPPSSKEGEGEGINGRDGRLGEMPRKRKYEDSEAINESNDENEDEDDDNEFEGFDNEVNDDSNVEIQVSSPEDSDAGVDLQEEG